MLTEGPAQNQGRRSITTGERIPNAAIFLKRTALEFLQILFSTRATGSLHYDTEETRTEIQISDVRAVNLSTVSRRPAIIAVRGPLSWRGMGLGGESLETQDLKTGARTLNDLLTGSVAFSCISREGIEAEQIGHIVFNSFKFFGPVLRKYGFFSIKSLNIGAETIIEQEGEDDRTSMVPVYITADIQDRWTLTPTVSQVLERIVIEHLVKIEGE